LFWSKLFKNKKVSRRKIGKIQYTKFTKIIKTKINCNNEKKAKNSAMSNRERERERDLMIR